MKRRLDMPNASRSTEGATPKWERAMSSSQSSVSLCQSIMSITSRVMALCRMLSRKSGLPRPAIISRSRHFRSKGSAAISVSIPLPGTTGPK